MSQSNLTSKQELFAQSVASGMNQIDAYRVAYPGTKMKDKTIHEAASRLAANSKVIARIEEIRRPVVEEARITLKEHLEELARLRESAKVSKDWSPAITAETNRGKASGLYVEKVEHSGNIVLTIEEILKRAAS